MIIKGIAEMEISILISRLKWTTWKMLNSRIRQAEKQEKKKRIHAIAKCFEFHGNAIMCGIIFFIDVGFSGEYFQDRHFDCKIVYCAFLNK